MPEGSNALVRARLEKLERLRARGVDPYPSSYRRTHTARQARDLFESLDPADADRRTAPVSVAGRITALRRMGRATFVDLLDGSGTIQVLFRKNALPDSYDVLPDLDIGDWLGVTGSVFNTRTGQTSVDAEDFSLLCKSMRPLPEKWHGLTDVEARFRQRYLDLISNDEARRVAVLRARTVSALRRWMDGRGFLEVETPVLVPVAAGAMAHPFVTHHNALDRDLYLRIAHELYLKRLIVGGLEKVYEIGKVFRNEGVDLEHNPEFTMMESYEAYADYNDVMRMVEELVSDLARELLGTTVVELDGEPIDLAPPWARVSLREEAIRQTGIDFLKHTTVGSLQAEMQAAGIDVTRQSSWGGLVDKLISTSVEPTLAQPTFLVDYPVATSPLAKRKPGDARVVERFEGFVAGMEVCNAFSELNDPVDQLRRLEEQESLRARFQEEEMDRLDADYVRAIEHGMPPTGGLGIGVDRLVMLFSGHRSIREVVLFPQLRGQ